MIYDVENRHRLRPVHWKTQCGHKVTVYRAQRDTHIPPDIEEAGLSTEEYDRVVRTWTIDPDRGSYGMD